MQAIKRILSMIIISGLTIVMMTACGSTIGIKDVEGFIAGEINKIMTGAIEGRSFEEISIQVDSSEFEDWYNQMSEQWYIEPADNESFSFQARIENLRVVSKHGNESELECEFTYEYVRTINNSIDKDEYVIGKGEIGETIVKIGYNGNRIILKDIQPIVFL